METDPDVGLHTVAIEEILIGEKLTTLVVSKESNAAVTITDNLEPQVADIFEDMHDDAIQ